jgi:hypothetical protein
LLLPKADFECPKPSWGEPAEASPPSPPILPKITGLFGGSLGGILQLEIQAIRSKVGHRRGIQAILRGRAVVLGRAVSLLEMEMEMDSFALLVNRVH